jgi:hypothetical protein
MLAALAERCDASFGVPADLDQRLKFSDALRDASFTFRQRTSNGFRGLVAEDLRMIDRLAHFIFLSTM